MPLSESHLRWMTSISDLAREDGDEQVADRFEEIRRDEAFHQLAFHEALIKIQTRQRTMRGATRRSSKAHDF
jgi:rubrerythrin